MKTLEEVVKQIKDEINADVVNKLVPIDIESFGELHDFVDANCYGGFCDDNGITEELIELHGGRNEHEGMPQPVLDFINAAQKDIDQWIKDDGVRDYMSHTDWDAFGATEFAECLRSKKKLAQTLDTLISSDNQMLLQHAVNLEHARRVWNANR